MTTPIAQIETLDGLQTLTQFCGSPDSDRRCIELGSVRLNRSQLLERLALPFVLENVVGAPLREELMLCGTMFDLLVFRHRIFEFGGVQPPRAPRACNHWSHVGQADTWRRAKGDTSQGALDRPKGAFVSPSGNPNREKGSVSEWLAAMGTPWMDRRGVTQAIPPAYTEFIGRHLLRQL